MTKAELRNAILVKLRVKRSEEEPNADDAAIVERAIDGQLESYLADGFFIDATNIPLQIQRPLIVVMANDLADDFHVAEQRAVRLALTAPRQDMMVRHYLSLKVGAEPIRATYF